MIDGMTQIKIRLFIKQDLQVGNSVVLTSKQANYLFNVMRINLGEKLYIFNNNDGEWLSEIVHKNKRVGELVCVAKIRDVDYPQDLWLLFSPIKKARTDFIVEKATEMGVSRIIPVITDYTNINRASKDRLYAHAVEAAEQCGTNFVPEVEELTKLNFLLNNWPSNRKIMFCDEDKSGTRLTLNKDSKGPWAILVGPEGGFSHREREQLLSRKFMCPISLGPRILRADTAVVAALTLWQSTLGDWL